MIRICELLIISSLAALATGTAAFTPSSHTTSKWGLSPTATGSVSTSTQLFGEKQDLVLDTDFDNVNIVRLLGLKTVKKLIRKNKVGQGEDSISSIESSVPAATADAKSALKLIIAGAPASGKGTQCELIKEKYGVTHLSTGDMLRAAVAAGSEVGTLAKEYMDSGKLVPDEVIIGVVQDRLNEDDCKTNGWLLDGFPRTPAQAEALAAAGVKADCFLFLNVPDEVLVERVVGRRTDPETGKIYHMTFSPPDDEEILARLEQRSDDTEEKVKVRLEQFHANVDAVKGSYSDISVEIDGSVKPSDVAVAVESAIQSKVRG